MAQAETIRWVVSDNEEKALSLLVTSGFVANRVPILIREYLVLLRPQSIRFFLNSEKSRITIAHTMEN
jgi:hypothetical protein